MPRRAQGVSTTEFTFARVGALTPSHNAKRNVLFFRIGPPTLSVYCGRFLQSRGGGVGRVLLFFHVFASNALFRMLNTVLPCHSFPPDLVRSWICPLPRPSSASTG